MYGETDPERLKQPLDRYICVGVGCVTLVVLPSDPALYSDDTLKQLHQRLCSVCMGAKTTKKKELT
jgi:hypothetical protein